MIRNWDTLYVSCWGNSLRGCRPRRTRRGLVRPTSVPTSYWKTRHNCWVLNASTLHWLHEMSVYRIVATVEMMQLVAVVIISHTCMMHSAVSWGILCYWSGHFVILFCTDCMPCWFLAPTVLHIPVILVSGIFVVNTAVPNVLLEIGLFQSDKLRFPADQISWVSDWVSEWVIEYAIFLHRLA